MSQREGDYEAGGKKRADFKFLFVAWHLNAYLLYFFSLYPLTEYHNGQVPTNPTMAKDKTFLLPVYKTNIGTSLT